MKDKRGDIRYHKVFEWILPRYRKMASTDEEDDGEDNNEEGDDEIRNNIIGFFEFFAGRMCNYMVHIIRSKKYKPLYYNPSGGFTITSDHVLRFFGCHMGQMFSGSPYIPWMLLVQ